MKKWVLEIERLASIASSQPHAAYTAFTHGLSASWNYASRTILDIGDLLDPVEKAIRHKLFPALTGRSAVSDLERVLFSLPVHLGPENCKSIKECCQSVQRIYQNLCPPHHSHHSAEQQL